MFTKFYFPNCLIACNDFEENLDKSACTTFRYLQINNERSQAKKISLAYYLKANKRIAILRLLC